MSKKQALKSVIAKRYASALFDLASEKDAQAKVKEELAHIASIIKSSKDLQRAITSRIIDKKSFSGAISEILKKAKCTELVIKFCKVMVKNGRTSLLPEVIESYMDLLAEAEGQIKVEVTTAMPVGRKQLDEISEAISSLTDKKPIIKEKVDNRILGGVIINIGSRMIDGSINGKLERLRIAQKNSSGM